MQILNSVQKALNQSCEAGNEEKQSFAYLKWICQRQRRELLAYPVWGSRHFMKEQLSHVFQTRECFKLNVIKMFFCVTESVWQLL